MKHNFRNFIVLLAAGALLTATPQGSSFLTEPTGQLVSAAVENHTSKKATDSDNKQTDNTNNSNKSTIIDSASSISAKDTESSTRNDKDNKAAKAETDGDTEPLSETIESSITNDSTVTSVGTFKTQDINGNEYTQDMFSDYDLTMVNVFATWCSPCVNELPDLQKLSEEVESDKDNKIQIVGIVLDSVGANGETDSDILEKAQTLQSQVQITYPLLIPDSGNLNGRLKDIQAVPETFFVDKKGNIVGNTYSGSHTLQEWEEIIDAELTAAKETK